MKKLLLTFLGAAALNSFGFAQYCFSGATSTGDSKINQVTLAGNATTIQSPLSPNGGGCATYTDYTALPAAELSLGLSYNVDVLMGTCGGFQFSKYTKVFIDWNNDGDFFDPGEELGFINSGSGVTPGLLSIPFTVPATATPGVTTRMRVVCRESGSAFSTQPCGTYTWGETEDYSVFLLPPGLTAVMPDTIELACYGDTTAAINPFVVGGTAPYTYAWSTGSTAASISSLGAGFYELTVTDAVGDMDTAYTAVVQPDSVGVNASVITQLVCDYNLSESNAVGFGGTPSSGYYWDTTSANFNPDTSQVGTLVTLSGYQMSSALDIGFDFVFFGDTHSQFRIFSDGFVSFAGNTTGGGPQTLPNAFNPSNLVALSWEDLEPQNGGTISYYTTGTAPFRVLHVSFTDIPYWLGTVGDVTVQGKFFETTNCIEIHTTTSGGVPGAGNQTQGIENQNGTIGYTYPGRNNQFWSSQNDFISFCPYDNTGLIYTWSSGDVGSTVFGLQPGSYTVTATDANGCTNTDDITINAPVSALVSALNAVDVSCFGFDDASVNPTITGGVNPVTYTWSNGATTSSISNLEPGTYSVSAEDAVGCTIEVNNVTVVEPAILLSSVFQVQNAVCENDENGSASIVVSGGIPPYTPLWSNGEVAYTATQLPSGGNFVQITDANGCQAFLTVNILYDFNSPTPDIGNNFINQTGAGVTLNTNPSSYSSYLWNNGATTPTILASATGFYWVEVTNAAGCVGSDTAYVEVWPTGVSELSELVGVTMYPNPARDMINFEISTDINALNVSIVDVKGSTVARTTFNNSGVQSLSLDNIAAGVYSVQLSTEEGQVSTQRLVVTK